PPHVIAVRATIALVMAGAVGIATYGRFVVSRAPAQPAVIREDVQIAGALAAAVAAECDRAGLDPLARSPLATSARTVWASIDCGFETERGSGIAGRATRFPELGDRSALHPRWTG